MKVVRRADIDFAQLANGETRAYYKESQFEIIETVVPPGHTQPLHFHEQISEYYIVLEGKLTFVEGESSVELNQGDAILFEPSNQFHTVHNHGETPARTVTLKFINRGFDDTGVFKSDKVSKDSA